MVALLPTVKMQSFALITKPLMPVRVCCLPLPCYDPSSACQIRSTFSPLPHIGTM